MVLDQRHHLAIPELAQRLGADQAGALRALLHRGLPGADPPGFRTRAAGEIPHRAGHILRRLLIGRRHEQLQSTVGEEHRGALAPVEPPVAQRGDGLDDDHHPPAIASQRGDALLQGLHPTEGREFVEEEQDGVWLVGAGLGALQQGDGLLEQEAHQRSQRDEVVRRDHDEHRGRIAPHLRDVEVGRLGRASHHAVGPEREATVRQNREVGGEDPALHPGHAAEDAGGFFSCSFLGQRLEQVEQLAGC